MPTKPGQQCINIPLRKFGEPYYIMERGSIELKMQMLLASLQRSASDSFNIKQLEQVRSFVVRLSYLSFVYVMQPTINPIICSLVHPFGHQELRASGEHVEELKYQGLAGFGFHYHRTFGLHICQGSDA